MEGLDILKNIQKYNILVITEIMNKEKLFLLNEECRKYRTGFIYSSAIGITGFCFIDFGYHKIIDKNGEECKSYIIKNISKDGEIFIDKTFVNNRYNINKGKYVIFKEIGGLLELNDGNPRLITKCNHNSFFISDSLNYENYTSGGICEEIKQSFIKKYYTLKERYYIPYLEKKPFPFDFSKQGRNELIHCGILALHESYENHNNSLSELKNQGISKEILGIAKDIL
jgi:hypothetical protein